MGKRNTSSLQYPVQAWEAECEKHRQAEKLADPLAQYYAKAEAECAARMGRPVNPETPLPSIYGASSLSHASMWLSLRDNPSSRYTWTARWPSLVGTLPESPNFAKIFWLQDHHDVAKAKYLILFAEEKDSLRGALFEAGIAVGLGKHVILVGYHALFGTWQYHPQISHAADMEEAFQLIDLIELF